MKDTKEKTARARRDFLKKAGKFAVYTPPTIMMLMHPSANATGGSITGNNGFRESIKGDSGFKESIKGDKGFKGSIKGSNGFKESLKGK